MVFPAHAGPVREGDGPFEHQPKKCAVLSVRLELCVPFHLTPCLSHNTPAGNTLPGAQVTLRQSRPLPLYHPATPTRQTPMWPHPWGRRRPSHRSRPHMGVARPRLLWTVVAPECPTPLGRPSEVPAVQRFEQGARTRLRHPRLMSDRPRVPEPPSPYPRSFRIANHSRALLRHWPHGTLFCLFCFFYYTPRVC